MKTQIEKFKDVKVLVIGDLMVDEYLFGTVDRISQEAPVQIVDVKNKEFRLGGAGNVVNNLKSFDANVTFVGVIGIEECNEFLFNEFKRLGMQNSLLIKSNIRPTTKKTRVIANNQQILRIDTESRKQISVDVEEEILKFVEDNIKKHDVIIISDYLKGVITYAVSCRIIELANKYKIPVIVDSKDKDFTKYKNATLLTPNKKEAERLSGMKIFDNFSAVSAAIFILHKTKCEAVLITRGKESCTLCVSDDTIKHIPSKAVEVFDVSGAGDTVVALCALGIGTGMSFEDASYIANIAAGIVVGKVGTSTATKEEIINRLTN